MGTPLGDFVRAKRDSTTPEDVGTTAPDRRRAPGLRRSELAHRANISVEYLTRIEQGRDRNPSSPVLTALADALQLGAGERIHLRYLAKLSAGACAAHSQPEPPDRTVRPAALEVLRRLEPGVAVITNRLGDVLAHTTGFDLLMRPTGLLDADEPNLTTFVFTDPRARTTFPDWDHVADQQVFDLWLGPSVAASEWFKAQLAPVAGAEFTRRIDQHLPPAHQTLRMNTPAGETRWTRETLELPSGDAQQLLVYLPADAATSTALEQLRHSQASTLRAV